MFFQYLFILLNFTAQPAIGIPSVKADLTRQIPLSLAACESFNTTSKNESMDIGGIAVPLVQSHLIFPQNRPENIIETLSLAPDCRTHQRLGTLKNALRGPPSSVWNGTRIGSDVYGRFALGSPVAPNRVKAELPPGLRRTAAENKHARNYFKNNKQKTRDAYTERTGQEWPVDDAGNPWPAEHVRSLKEGGDPMVVEPRNPATDPHNIPGPDGLTDYQRWGAEGTPAREARRKGH